MDLSAHRPDRIDLAHVPTPLQYMERLSRRVGVEIYFKRDDYTGSELSGNKIRKLSFLLAEARTKGADTVITCGGARSNHCRATALAAIKAGLRSRLLLRTEDPQNPPQTAGNILLDRLAAAEIVWITPARYQQREEEFAHQAQLLRSEGREAYIIPEGGPNALGAWGYVTAMEELVTDLTRIDGGSIKPTTVISATGSGGTTAGLALGAHLLKMPLNVIGVNVSDDRKYFESLINAICQGFMVRYLPDDDPTLPPYTIVDGYVGRGYALSRPEELSALRDLVRLEGVVLDPVYTGKAYYGMISELEKDRRAFGERVVFVHTGGLFGLLPIADQFEQIT